MVVSDLGTSSRDEPSDLFLGVPVLGSASSEKDRGLDTPHPLPSPPPTLGDSLMGKGKPRTDTQGQSPESLPAAHKNRLRRPLRKRLSLVREQAHAIPGFLSFFSSGWVLGTALRNGDDLG